MKDPDGARLPGTMRLARTQNAGRAHQRERGKAARDQPLLDLTFDPHIEGPGLWIGSDRGVKGKALRAVLVQESGHSQRIVHIHFAESLVRTGLAHGCAQGADACIHIPPRRVGGQSVEVHQRIFKTVLRRQRLAGDCDYFADPVIGKRLLQD